MKLHGEVCEVPALAASDRASMFALMAAHYGNVRRERFEADLDEKEWAIVVRSPAAGQLVGFSTQVLREVDWDGTRIRVLFSGDTVVDRQHWGDPALPHAWGNFALDLIDRLDDHLLYWFLISKGFRTYRYLPLFFRTYWPHAQFATPAREASLIDQLGRQFGGENYDRLLRVIRARGEKDFVRAEFAAATSRSQTDRHVRHFLKLNPGHERGDELCCVAPLTRANFTRAAYRVIGARPSPAIVR